jgi:hypothetical protein
VSHGGGVADATGGGEAFVGGTAAFRADVRNVRQRTVWSEYCPVRRGLSCAGPPGNSYGRTGDASASDQQYRQ